MNGLHRTPDQIKQRSNLADALYSAIVDDQHYDVLETILDDYAYRLKDAEVDEWEDLVVNQFDEPEYVVK